MTEDHATPQGGRPFTLYNRKSVSFKVRLIVKIINNSLGLCHEIFHRVFFHQTTYPGSRTILKFSSFCGNFETPDKDVLESRDSIFKAFSVKSHALSTVFIATIIKKNILLSPVHKNAPSHFLRVFKNVHDLTLSDRIPVV